MPAPAQAQCGGAAWRRLLFLLTALPLALALLAFALQWRGGGVDDPATRWPPHLAEQTTPHGPSHPSSSSACVDVLAASSAPAFPYLHGWSFPFDAPETLHPKVCVQTSTSAGLDQILPWLFYHKAVGVGHFLLFVEGKAAKPGVAAVLESNPVRFPTSDFPNPVRFPTSDWLWMLQHMELPV